MNNEQRRQGLSEARRKALDYARSADAFHIVSVGNGDGPAVDDMMVRRREHLMALATMWANVADALKVGAADGPDVVDAYLGDTYTREG